MYGCIIGCFIISGMVKHWKANFLHKVYPGDPETRFQRCSSGRTTDYINSAGRM